MNRVILLGNGFDLAHGRKTSYADFIKWYIGQCAKTAVKRDYVDTLIKVSPTPYYRGDRLNNDIEDWVNECYNEGLDLKKFGRPVLDLGGLNYRYPFIFQPQSRILENMLKQCSVGRWVDIEAIFYSTLIEILDANGRTNKEESLTLLNRSMHELKMQLQTYLLSLPKPTHNQDYVNILDEYILDDDIESARKGEKQRNYLYEKPKNTLILNFNYTDTIELYFDKTYKTARNININYIHGKLNDEQNPIVFGFGDELDKRYSQIENETAKGYFDYIKSFWYLRTSNYRDLVRFVDGEEYQVFILGHSCGLSDRTMLHMILQNDNCRSIKIFYHGTEMDNNYTQTTYEIARHFNDKELMRKRIVSLNKSKNMPQAKK